MSFDYLDNKGKALFKSLSINAVYMYVYNSEQALKCKSIYFNFSIEFIYPDSAPFHI